MGNQTGIVSASETEQSSPCSPTGSPEGFPCRRNGAKVSDPNDSPAVAEQVPSKASCSAQPTNSKGKRICCVCKETKLVRDECVVLNGQENCLAFIDAHNQCLRAEGFEITPL
eukprot:GHVT01045895.1.p2 GENE.GHVT01045895.1~~GHVT01045895.1.p2  ORF type:complete len:113 (+),score=8.45 GHVT01045895.1:268-606(+)